MSIDASFTPPKAVQNVGYDREKHGIGIVHFGVGAFHRAHQAVYTDDVLAKHGGNWRILGVSLQSTGGADALNAQDGIYSLAVREGDGQQLSLRLIGSIVAVEAAVRSTDRIFQTLADPQTRIVTMTVTEKAYGVDRNSGGVDISHPSIAHDLKDPSNPIGIIGMIVKGLALRKDADLKPYTVLCCDNLPKNGEIVRSGVVDFARRTDPALAEWIEVHGTFPSAMVDRITPSVTPELLSEVEKILGQKDAAAVETEPFSQWVVEDRFCDGRPKWEDAGVLFVDDVAPYERMKLRMLNGAHSLIAYAGFLAGHKYVRDAMADPQIHELVEKHIRAASKTLTPLSGIVFEEYSKQLIERFENPNIAHETYQIAMDGSQKIPQRIFEPAVESLKDGLDITPFAYATAAWIRYCAGTTDTGRTYELRDPRQDELQSAFKSGNGNVNDICTTFMHLPGLFPSELQESDVWIAELENQLASILKQHPLG